MTDVETETKQTETMEIIKEFPFLQQRLKGMTEKKRVALACPHDGHTEYVIERALDEGFARFVLTLSRPVSDRLARCIERHGQEVETMTCNSDEEAAERAVEAVRTNRAQVLMKGTLNTDVLLRAVLDKKRGLLKEGDVMNHIALCHIPDYGKPLMFSDAAVVPRPSLEQMDAIVGHCVNACRRLGIDSPYVALTHCTEKVNPKFEHTMHYQQIKRWAEEGRYGRAVVDGPMDVKTALDAESGAIKGICSPVAGRADVLIFPNIEAGNTFYKTVTLFAHATTAGWLEGTVAPIVVASRADSEVSKYYSLAMACL